MPIWLLVSIMAIVLILLIVLVVKAWPFFLVVGLLITLAMLLSEPLGIDITPLYDFFGAIGAFLSDFFNQVVSIGG